MNIRFRNVAAYAVVMSLAFDTACYRYVPAPTPEPAPGTDVRVELTPEGSTELARYLGPRVVSVDGTLSSIAGDGAMMIAGTSVALADGSHQRWVGDDVVSFPRAYLSGVQVRTLDRRKSTIAALVIAGSLLAAGAIVSGASRGSPPSTDPGTGVFSIRY